MRRSSGGAVIAAMRLAKELHPLGHGGDAGDPPGRARACERAVSASSRTWASTRTSTCWSSASPSATGTSSPGAASRSRTPPFEVMYGSGYWGAWPLRAARSWRWSSCCGRSARGLGCGLHYCSLENRPRRDAPEERARRACAPVRGAFRRGRFLPEDGEGLRAGRGAGARRARGGGLHGLHGGCRGGLASRSRRATWRQCGALPAPRWRAGTAPKMLPRVRDRRGRRGYLIDVALRPA